MHIKGLKFLKHHYYCDCYISQIKVLTNEEKYNIIQEYAIQEEEIVKEDFDILDEEVISEMKKQKEEKKLKEEQKKNIQQEILKLQQQLDNL